MYRDEDYAPPATMAETSAYYHDVLGTSCPFDCWRCDAAPDDDFVEFAVAVDAAAGAVHIDGIDYFEPPF